MIAGRVETASSALGEREDEVRAIIQKLGAERNLKGLVAVAMMSVSELRMLCERPVTCADLNEMQDALDRLLLDEPEEEE